MHGIVCHPFRQIKENGRVNRTADWRGEFFSVRRSQRIVKLSYFTVHYIRGLVYKIYTIFLRYPLTDGKMRKEYFFKNHIHRTFLRLSDEFFYFIEDEAFCLGTDRLIK